MQSNGMSVVSEPPPPGHKQAQPYITCHNTSPRIEQETVIAAGTASTCSCSISPNDANKTAGKIRPATENRIAAATTSAASFMSANSK